MNAGRGRATNFIDARLRDGETENMEQADNFIRAMIDAVTEIDEYESRRGFGLMGARGLSFEEECEAED